MLDESPTVRDCEVLLTTIVFMTMWMVDNSTLTAVPKTVKEKKKKR